MTKSDFDEKNKLNIPNYIEIIEAYQQEKYQFIKFNDNVVGLIEKSIPFVLFRHDIDFNLRNAVQISRLENSLGIKSSFFFQLRTPLYNILSAYAREVIEEIHEHGHDICLHFDMRFYGEDFHIGLIEELDFLIKIFPFANSKIISFHRIGKRAFDLDIIPMPENVNHTYQDIYFKLIGYHSDSGGRWKRGNPILTEEFSSRKSMQILTHPMWWTENGSNPFEKINDHLLKNREQTIDFLENTVISYSLEPIRN